MRKMNIFNYQNFRLFLGDYLSYKKEQDKSFSQRAILRQMKISSTGFLANVISGRNNLTTEQTKSLAAILKLKKLEQEYFKALVPFTQAKTIEDKNKFFEKMTKVYKSKFRTLSPKQLSLFADWNYAIVREILSLTEFKGDFKALGKMVKPKINEATAKKAVEELEKIGLIKKDAEGIYRQYPGTVATVDEVKSLYVSNFLLDTMENAQRSLDITEAAERDISALTLRVSENKMKEIKAEIKMFRKRLLQITENDSKKDRVYQCNINFFPASEKVK